MCITTATCPPTAADVRRPCTDWCSLRTRPRTSGVAAIPRHPRRRGSVSSRQTCSCSTAVGRYCPCRGANDMKRSQCNTHLVAHGCIGTRPADFANGVRVRDRRADAAVRTAANVAGCTLSPRLASPAWRDKRVVGPARMAETSEGTSAKTASGDDRVVRAVTAMGKVLERAFVDGTHGSRPRPRMGVMQRRGWAACSVRVRLVRVVVGGRAVLGCAVVRSRRKIGGTSFCACTYGGQGWEGQAEDGA
ncbi:hypothetical protein BD309DRAFT_663970 [Dichomitus squalens]|uniref:Uncharacterized protein n=1 Tax=Dichomitus squalens TaxID=114155 RepID=A0A4Q9N9R6_9APHY|nr:hypothetical protein BD309DRAFT_663970 [Dichomitus squalens]TBU56324.1 hypothetical protein BD310DRAFT_630242 [Dichomitus squalens]